MKINTISFKAIPQNYSQIDRILSRSAQPLLADFEWLKSQGVTDIVNFRTMFVSGVDFDEKAIVESLEMKYHNIPTITAYPKEEQVKEFLGLADDVCRKNGKLHLHCAAGADRTGMYSFIYKTIKNIGTMIDNENEWIVKGHNMLRYPNLIPWAKAVLQRIKK